MKSLLYQHKNDFKSIDKDIKRLRNLISKIENKSLSIMKILNQHFNELNDQDKETVKCLSYDDGLIEKLSYGLQLSKDALKQIIESANDTSDYMIDGLLK